LFVDGAVLATLAPMQAPDLMAAKSTCGGGVTAEMLSTILLSLILTISLLGKDCSVELWGVDDDDDARSKLEELRTCGEGSAVSIVEARDERC